MHLQHSLQADQRIEETCRPAVVRRDENPLKPVSPKDLTIVTACMNRQQNLKVAIRSWLELKPFQIIICDWGCTEPIVPQNLVEPELEDRIKIVRMEADSWVLSWAFNEALALSQSAYTLKLDCDHVISRDFLDANPCRELHFLRGHWSTAEPGQEYINGAFLSCTRLLAETGFYDERITTYGWDDSDLYERLYDRSRSSGILAKDSILHLEQDETDRTAHQDISVEAKIASYLDIKKTDFLIARNRLFRGMIWPWDHHMFSHRSTLRNRQLHDKALLQIANYRAFELHFEWKRGGVAGALDTYYDLISDTTFESEASALGLDFPDIMERYAFYMRTGDSTMKKVIQVALASYLSKERSNGEIGSLEDLAQRFGKMFSSPGTTRPLSFLQNRHIGGFVRRLKGRVSSTVSEKQLILLARHGLGNRLRAIASAKCICDKSGRKLVVCWDQDDHCDGKITELFDPLSLSFDVRTSDYLKTILDHRYYSYMDGCPNSRKGEEIDLDTRLPVVVESSSALISTLTDWQAECDVLKSLRPSAKVLEILGQIPDLKGFVGVQIRTQGATGQVLASFDMPQNWGAEAHLEIQKWRDQSQPDRFRNRMASLLREKPGTRFFVATDSSEVCAQMLTWFGESMVFIPKPEEAYLRNTMGLQYALADAIALSRCNRLLGSGWSSFTELAIRLSFGHEKVEIAGVDF